MSAMRCPTCGDAVGTVDPDDMSMTCIAVIVGWSGGRSITRAGCGLRLWLCPVHGLRTLRERPPSGLRADVPAELKPRCACAAHAMETAAAA